MMKQQLRLMLTLAIAFVSGSVCAQKTAYGLTMDNSPKLVSFTTDAPATTTSLASVPVDPRSGAAVKNTLYFYGLDDDWNDLFYTADLTTGTVTKVGKASVDAMPADLSYDYAGDQMYYLATDLSHDSRSVFGTVNLATGKTTKVKDNITYSKAMAINAAGEVYVLGNDAKLYTLDKATGDMTAVGATGLTLNGSWNFQSMDFDRATGTLYLAAWLTGDKAELYTLNTTTGAATKVGAFGAADGVHTVALTIPYIPSEDAAPKKVKNLTVTADQTGALKATIAWTNPTTDNLDHTLTALAKAEVLRGDDLIATLTDVQPGIDASYTDEVAQAGRYKYTVRVYNGELPSADQFVEAWVGHDVSAAVGDATAALNPSALMQNVLTWNAPSAGKNGGFIDTQSLRYDIIRKNDNKTVASNLTACTYTDTDLLTDLARYSYEVVAKNADGTGATALTNDLVNGPSQAAPFVADFSTWQGGGEFWTVIDGNDDGCTFRWYNDYMNMFGQGADKGYYIYEPSETFYGYDFIVSPPLLFTEGHDYLIAATVSNDDIAGYREESFRFFTMNGYTLTGAVPLGDEAFTVKHPGEFKTYGYLFRVDDDGVGAADETFSSFIALCCTSTYDMGMLLVSQISVTDVTELTAIRDVEKWGNGENEKMRNGANENAPRYNALGQRVGSNAKGLIIQNGRKRIVR